MAGPAFVKAIIDLSALWTQEDFFGHLRKHRESEDFFYVTPCSLV
jgi:hypothetical protein